jgi:hypothetical protein
VNADTLRAENHFVARGYLKRWVNDERLVWTYRLLVEHPRVDEWRAYSTKAIARHRHLYTQMVGGRESDEVERRFNAEIESPAENALKRVTTGRHLRRHEWDDLYRCVAAQQVRTPAYLERNYPQWLRFVRESADETKQAMQAAIDERGELPPPGVIGPDPLHMKITWPSQLEEGETGHIHVEVPVGRAFWLWVIDLALGDVWKALRAHQWLILRPPRGFAWCTTDDPVILLPAGPGQGDAGWGLPGTEIVFPLGPSHLLYTRVGGGGRFTVNVSTEQAQWLQRVIVDHAYRAVFAATPDPSVREMRQRVVSRQRCQAERELWQRWHAEQSAMELGFDAGS